MVIRKRCVKSRKTGQLLEYCYDTIGSKPVNDYFRAKSAEYRRRDGVAAVNHTPPLSEYELRMVIQLHKAGLSQQAIASTLGTSRYRIQRALGLR